MIFGNKVPAAAILCVIIHAGAVWSQATMTIDQAFSALSSYDEGSDTRPLDVINERVGAAANTFTLKRDLEARLLDTIRVPGLSDSARDFALKQLYRVATERSVDVLSPLLYDSETSEMARVALEKVRANTATDALVAAMQKTKGHMRAGIIYSLGERKDQRAAKPITKFSGRGESEVVRAAIWALGEIGGPDAVKDLRWCRGNTLKQHRDFATSALFRAADRYLEEDNIRGAIEIYDSLFVDLEPIAVRQKALRGILRAEGDAAIDTVLAVLRTEGPELQDAAFHAIHDLPGERVTQRCAGTLPSLTPDNQIRMVHALAERGDYAALPPMHDLLRSSNAAVRGATIEALGTLGDDRSVAALLAYFLRARPGELDQIRTSLTTMTGPGVDDELIEEVLGPNKRVKSEIIAILVARESQKAAPALIRLAEREIASLQLQALEGLGKIASAEAIPLLIEYMLTAESAAARSAAREATLDTLLRAGHSTEGSDALAAALKRGDVPNDVKLDLLELVRQTEDVAAIPALENLVRKDNGELGRASLDALSNWPNAAPLEAMRGLAKTMRKSSFRDAWVAGYLRLVDLADSDSPGLLAHYQTLADAVETTAEKESLLESLRAWGAPEGASVAGKFVDDSAVGGLAAEVVSQLTN